MTREQQGTVKWFDPERAYGFITVETGEDVFVHRNSIVDGRSWLVDGQRVSLIVRPGMKGTEAAEVRVTQDVASVPTWREAAYQRATTGGGAGDRFGGRDDRPRRPREPYQGPTPDGEVTATVQRIDPMGRFLFVRLDQHNLDVFVHGSFINRLERDLFEGDRVRVIVEQSERGPRACSLALA